MAMGHRERVLKTLNHEEPDRIPFDLGGTSNSSIHIAKYQELKAHFGIEKVDVIANKYLQSVVVDEEILQALDIDFRHLAMGTPDAQVEFDVGNGDYKDEFGVTRRMPEGSLYYDVVDFPLAGNISISDIVNYPWPDPTDPGLTRGLRDRALALRENTDCAIALKVPAPFVHSTQFLRGFEDWFMDLAGDPKMATALFEANVEVTAEQARRLLVEVGDIVDIVAMGDDLGFQNGPMVSPDTYRRLLKPHHKKYFDTLKAGTDAHIHFHSCGSINLLLDDLIEIGVSAINPVQVAADNMDSASLVAEFGDRVTFWGAIDTQEVMPTGTPEDVRAEVKKRISDFAPGGGYVLSAVHNIQPDVPLENILAMYDAGREFGNYPIAGG